MPLSHRRLRTPLIAGLALAAGVALFFVPRIPQDPAYHNFADTRPLAGIPNFGDVASNLPFSVVGAVALVWILRRNRVGPDRPFLTAVERRVWIFVFVGCFFTGLGSGWYHWEPGTARLFWDRLPMTVVFMSLLGVQVMERISLRAGAALVVPFLVFGVASVVAWRWGEMRGAGDLRLYALVQFYPMLAIPLMLVLYPRRYDRTLDLVLVFGWYGLAKVNEALDVRIFEWMGHAVSGHTLKHLAAGAGMAQLLRMVILRRPVGSPPVPRASAASLP
ncbi:MAG: alkaline phytoceramidase [Candidatus Brocadiae bacterium]|nr:alkaline phytoceramidase [Candidatus Brocadiia bacterium]